MCGRYQLDDDMKAIIERFDIESVFNEANRKIGEIFPTDKAPVVIGENGIHVLMTMKWGIRPHFMDKDIINTRQESLYVKKMFNTAISSARCLIPANGFYEWEKTNTGKIKRIIRVSDMPLFAFAGIFERNSEGIYTFSIITKEAAAAISHIHDRMPVIINPDDEAAWLRKESGADDVRRIIDMSVQKLNVA